MHARIVSSHGEAIVAPSLRPPDPDATPPLKRRLGFALVALGTFALVVGAFVSFGQWLFLVGSVFMVVGFWPWLMGSGVRWWALGLAVLFLAAAFWLPKLLQPLNDYLAKDAIEAYDAESERMFRVGAESPATRRPAADRGSS